jgi:hypothetical protein
VLSLGPAKRNPILVAQVISAEGSILLNISGRTLAKRDFVGHGNEIVDRTPEPGLNGRVAFDGLVTGKVSIGAFHRE